MPPEGDVTNQNTPAPIKLDGVDPLVVGHMQNRGWDKLPVEQVAIEAAKSHMEAQKFIGAPAEQIIRLPAATAKPEEWTPVWQRLGALPKQEDYKGVIGNFKFANGDAIDDQFGDALTKFSFDNHLTKEAAAALPKVIGDFMDQNDARQKTIDDATLATEKKALRESWGANFEVNELIAKETAKNLGVNAETVDALEKQIGYAGVMRMFHAIGSTHGEDNVITNLVNANNSKSLTKEQAKVRINELKADADFSARYIKGGVKEKEEMNALHQIAFGTTA